MLFEADPTLPASAVASVDDDPERGVERGVGIDPLPSPTPCVIVAWARAEIPAQAVVSLPRCLGGAELQWRATGVLGDALPTVYAAPQGSANAGRLELLLTQAPMYLEPVAAELGGQ